VLPHRSGSWHRAEDVDDWPGVGGPVRWALATVEHGDVNHITPGGLAHEGENDTDMRRAVEFGVVDIGPRSRPTLDYALRSMAPARSPVWRPFSSETRPLTMVARYPVAPWT
jgi:hypothetical protein